MAVKLVALDIDGTLLPFEGPHEGALSPRLRSAVAALAGRGVAVVLASGRMHPGAARIAQELQLAGPLIAQEGCVVASAAGEVVHEVRLAASLAQAVVAYARDEGHEYEWFGTSRYAVTKETPATRSYGEMCGVTPEYHAAPEALGIPPNGVGVLGDRKRSPAIHQALAEAHGDRLHLLDFSAVTVAISPTASKGRALAMVADDLGVPRHETVAIGDSVNDASMLAWAGRGLAMAKGDRYAHEAADEILPDEEDIVANVLEGLR